MEIFTVEGAGRYKLVTAVSRPEGQPKAVLQMVHGMAEHKERYFPMMEFLSKRGYICVMNDLRGHGASVESERDLGFFGRGGYNKLVEDERLVTLWARSEFPGLPIFLYGHSMGSMIVREYIKKNDDLIAGLIVCGSPSANGAVGLAKALAVIVLMFNGWRYRSSFLQSIATGGYDKVFKKEKTPNSWICTDKNVVDIYNADPLCGFRFTANGYLALFSLLKSIYSKKGWLLKNPGLPIMFIAGSDDPCIVNTKKYSEAVNFLRDRGYTSVTSKIYPEMRHEIHNEPGKEAVWQDIASAMELWGSK